MNFRVEKLCEWVLESISGLFTTAVINKFQFLEQNILTYRIFFLIENSISITPSFLILKLRIQDEVCCTDARSWWWTTIQAVRRGLQEQHYNVLLGFVPGWGHGLILKWFCTVIELTSAARDVLFAQILNYSYRMWDYRISCYEQWVGSMIPLMA